MRPLVEILKEELKESELSLVPKSYDVIGSKEKAVAIIEIPKELEDKKQLIAEAIITLNKNVKSVLNKVSGRKGAYRLEELELIAGDKNTEVVHKEFGYLLKLDPQKVFFSPRESTERQRIASQVKPNEIAAIFFSGVGVYAIAICKKQPLVNKVYAIEINPDAHNYARDNVRINKLSHKIVLINDDVKKVAKELKIKFDRIVMPLAVGGEEYLDEAFKLVRDNGIIHFYHTGKGEDLFSYAKNLVNDFARENGKNVKITNKVKVLPFGVRTWKIALDFIVSSELHHRQK